VEVIESAAGAAFINGTTSPVFVIFTAEFAPPIRWFACSMSPVGRYPEGNVNAVVSDAPVVIVPLSLTMFPRLRYAAVNQTPPVFFQEFVQHQQAAPP
jgi:hypothetical protein